MKTKLLVYDKKDIQLVAMEGRDKSIAIDARMQSTALCNIFANHLPSIVNDSFFLRIATMALPYNADPDKAKELAEKLHNACTSIGINS